MVPRCSIWSPVVTTLAPPSQTKSLVVAGEASPEPRSAANTGWRGGARWHTLPCLSPATHTVW